MLEELNTIEDLNSLLLLDPHFHKDYKINLGLLPDTEFSDYYYDFNVVDMNFDKASYMKLYRLQNSSLADDFVSNNLYCNSKEYLKDSFIQFDLKAVNPSKTKIGLYQENMNLINLCPISNFNLKNNEWVNVVITKIGSVISISVNGEVVFQDEYLDGRKKYKFAVGLGNKREKISIKNYQAIELDKGELIKEGIERNPETGKIIDCSKSYGTASTQCTTFNGEDLRHVHGTGYFSIGEEGINPYTNDVFLYKFYLNTSAGTTDLSKVKFSLSELQRKSNRVYGYDYKEWKFSDLFDEYQCATVHVLLYNKRIYFFDAEYGIRKIEDVPLVDTQVRLFIEINDTSLWIENFDVYKYTRDTSFLVDLQPLNQNNDVEKTQYNYNHYKIKVFNKLWNGELKFDRLNYYTDKPIFWTETENLNYNNEVYIIHILYDSDDFDVILTLDNDYTGKRKTYQRKTDENKLQDLKIVTDLTKEYTYLYNQRPTIKIKCLDGTGIPIYKVKCVNNEVGCNGSTNQNGEFSFIPKVLEPGTYYFNITLSKLGYETTYCKLKLEITKRPFVMRIENNMGYRGGYVTDTFYADYNGEDLSGIKVKITCEQSQINQSVVKELQYDHNRDVYYVEYEQSYRKKRIPKSDIKVTVLENKYIKESEFIFTKTLTIKSVNSWRALKNEIENEKGVDIVAIMPGHHRVDEMIQIRRDMEITGYVTSNDWSTFENTGNRNTTPKYAFSIFPKNEQWINVEIRNIKFWELNKCMFLNGYVNVKIDNCLFLGNSENLRQDLGLCIETNIGQTYVNNNYGNVEVTRCTFFNNKGSCIATSYNTNIHTCKFILNDWNYAQHPQAYGVEIYGQNTSIKDCDFILSMTGRSPLPNYEHSNFSHGSAPLRVAKNATVNGLYGSSIASDESGSLCANGCTAYSYARYKYDGENVTLSPALGYERCAYKHIVNGINWAWQNNTRVNSYYDNTNRRPSVRIPVSAEENQKINKINEREKW